MQHLMCLFDVDCLHVKATKNGKMKSPRFCLGQTQVASLDNFQPMTGFQ